VVRPGRRVRSSWDSCASAGWGVAAQDNRSCLRKRIACPNGEAARFAPPVTDACKNIVRSLRAPSRPRAAHQDALCVRDPRARTAEGEQDRMRRRSSPTPPCLRTPASGSPRSSAPVTACAECTDERLQPAPRWAPVRTKIGRPLAGKLPCRHPRALKRRSQPGGEREIGHEERSTGPWREEDCLLRSFGWKSHPSHYRQQVVVARAAARIVSATGARGDRGCREAWFVHATLTQWQ
jgi:hypothetical protein